MLNQFVDNRPPLLTPNQAEQFKGAFDPHLISAAVITAIARNKGITNIELPDVIPTDPTTEELNAINDKINSLLPKLYQIAQTEPHHPGIAVVGTPGAGKHTLVHAINKYFHSTATTERITYPYQVNYNHANRTEVPYELEALYAWLNSRILAEQRNTAKLIEDRKYGVFDVNIGLDWFTTLTTFAAYTGIRSAFPNSSGSYLIHAGFRGIPDMWTLLPLLSFIPDLVIVPYTPFDVKMQRIKLQLSTDPDAIIRRQTALQFDNIIQELQYDGLLRMQDYALRYFGRYIKLYFYPTVPINDWEYPLGFLPVNLQWRNNPNVNHVIDMLQRTYKNILTHRLTMEELKTNRFFALFEDTVGDPDEFGDGNGPFYGY